MSLEIIEKVGVSTNSGAPIFKVRCSFCKEEYRFTGFKSTIAKTKACLRCTQLNRIRHKKEA